MLARLRSSLLLALLALAILAITRHLEPDAAASPDGSEKKATIDFARDIAPLMQKYCVSCHGGAKAKAGVALDAFKTHADVEKQLKTWEKVADNLRSGDMPPPGRKQPTPAELELLNAWLDSAVFKINCDLREPGRVTIRRLNRAEYNNTIRDLVGVNFRPADDFPSDDVGYGFDNIGDVLSMPPILMEKYLAAAERILDEAIVPEVVVKSSKQMFRPQNLVVRPFTAKGKDDKKITFTTAGSAQMAKFHFPAEGDYIIRIRASGEAAGQDMPRMALSINDKDLKTFDVNPKETKSYEFRVKQTEGERKVSVSFLNPFKEEKPKDPPKDAKAKDEKVKDEKPKDEKPAAAEVIERKLIVEFIEVEGPLNAVPKPLPETTRRILIAKPTGKQDQEAAAARVIENFAPRPTVDRWRATRSSDCSGSLPWRARGTSRLKRLSSIRCKRFWCRHTSCSASSRTALPKTAAFSGSANSNSPHASPISSGRRCLTTNCSASRSKASCARPACSRPK